MYWAEVRCGVVLADGVDDVAFGPACHRARGRHPLNAVARDDVADFVPHHDRKQRWTASTVSVGFVLKPILALGANS